MSKGLTPTADQPPSQLILNNEQTADRARMTLQLGHRLEALAVPDADDG